MLLSKQWNECIQVHRNRILNFHVIFVIDDATLTKVKMMELMGCMTMRSLKSGPNQLCGRFTHVEERKV
ncbi:unnamed protein product [Lathyrus oleraceus]